MHRGKVLLRKHDKYGVWFSVGGRIELGEDPSEAAIREVKEEVGLDVELWDSRGGRDNSDEHFRELIPPVAIGRHKALHPTRSDHEHMTLVYFARAVTDRVSVQYEGDRSDEWRWFSRGRPERR